MTGTKDDYIKAIYELGGNKRIISNKEIANSLEISAPSVSEMIKKLLSEGYVDYISYKGVTLTKEGISYGRKLRNKYLIWEVFLQEKLKYDWKETGDLAERLQNVTDDELVQRLFKYLNKPSYCPHGSRILMDEEDLVEDIPLTQVFKGDLVKIVRFQNIKSLLEYVEIENIKLGDELEVIEIGEAGNLYIKINGQLASINENMLNHIFVDLISRLDDQ